MVSFRRFRGSHLEIDNEEQEASKDVVYLNSDVHPLNSQRDPVEIYGYVFMIRDAAMISERLV